MKHKHMFSLLDQSFTTVRVVFGIAPVNQKAPPRPWVDSHLEDEDFAQMSGRANRNGYVYKVPKAWNVQEGDMLLVCSSKNTPAVVTVIHVDLAPDIDVDANFDYKWAVQKVDLTEFNELNRKEKAFGDQMLEIERVKQRESLVASFRDSLPEGSEARKLFEQTTATTLSPPTVDAAPMQPPQSAGASY